VAPEEKEATTIEEAINDFTEEESEDEVGTEVASADDDTDVDDGTPEGEEEDDEDEVPDIEDDDEWGTSDEDDEEEDDDEEDEEEEDTSDEEDDDIWDEITPEQMEEINSNPALRNLRKSLMRGYNKKMQGRAQALQLIDAYEKNPRDVAKAIAEANGYSVAEAHAQVAAAKQNVQNQAEQTLDKISQARSDVADLFGDKVGPEVAQKLENFFNVLTETVVAPLSNQVGAITSRSEQARMMSEEAAWRQRNKDVLTDEVEKAVVKLGNSGMIVPGKGMAPGEYLDTLLRVALADSADVRVRSAKSGSSKRLASRIERNRRDREPTGVSSKAGVRKISRLKSNPENYDISSAFDQAARELKDEVG